MNTTDADIETLEQEAAQMRARMNRQAEELEAAMMRIAMLEEAIARLRAILNEVKA